MILRISPGGWIFLLQLGVLVLLILQRARGRDGNIPLPLHRSCSGAAARDNRESLPSILAWCTIIAAVGLASRLFFVFFSSFQAGDQPDYLTLARSIRETGTFQLHPGSPTSYRAPGYPLFLTTVQLVAGESTRAVLLIQAAIGAVSFSLLYLWLREFLAEPWARGAAILAAAYPHLSFYAGTVLAETILTAVIIALVYCVYRIQRPGASYWWSVGAGVLAAYAVLISPRMLAAPMLAVSALVVATHMGSPRKRHALLLLATSTALMLPWTVRNLLLFGVPSPSAIQNPKLQLWWAAKRVTMYDYSQDELRDEPLMRKYHTLLRDQANEQQNMPAWMDMEDSLFADAIREIRADPGAYLSDRLRKYPRLWIQPAMYAGYFHPPFQRQNAGLRQMLAKGDLLSASIRIFMTIAFVVLPFAFGLIGMTRMLKEWRHHAILYGLFLWVGLSVAPIFLEHRYAIPVHPFLALFAAIGMQTLVGWWKKRADRQLGTAAAASA